MVQRCLVHEMAQAENRWCEIFQIFCVTCLHLISFSCFLSISNCSYPSQLPCLSFRMLLLIIFCILVHFSLQHCSCCGQPRLTRPSCWNIHFKGSYKIYYSSLGREIFLRWWHNAAHTHFWLQGDLTFGTWQPRSLDCFL